MPDPQDPQESNEPTQDLRALGRQPIRPDANPDEADEGLRVMDPPEPLVIPVEQLHQEHDEHVLRMRAEAEERDAEVHIHVAEFIEVRAFSQVFSFMGLHMGTYKQARKVDGFAFGGIKGRWWAKKFWTYTVWRGREAKERYVAGQVHADLVSRLPELAAPGSCFVEWEGTGEPDWIEALERLRRPTRYYVGS